MHAATLAPPAPAPNDSLPQAPSSKPAPRAGAPAPRLLPGPANSIIYAIFDAGRDEWAFHCIGPRGVTEACASGPDAKKAYLNLAESQPGQRHSGSPL